MASGLCDLFDGTVAQTRARTAQEKRFGVQIDSLSDLVSFGVQPAAIGYCIGVRGAQVIVLCCYVLAALIRLAYYNVTEDELLEEGSGRDAYEGLPVTTATIMFPLLVAVRGFLGEAAPHVYAGAMLLMAAAFLVRIRIPKLHALGKAVAATLGVCVLTLVLLCA